MLGSHISWLSFPHNFSQRSYNQKFHLLKIKMRGTIGFFSSCFLFLCSESSQSFLHLSCTYLHFNTEICPQRVQILHLPQLPCFSLNGVTLLSALWSSDHLAVFQYLFACLLCTVSCQLFLCFHSHCPTPDILYYISLYHWKILISDTQFTCIQSLHPILFSVHHTPFSPLRPSKTPLSVFHPLFPSFPEVLTQT